MDKRSKAAGRGPGSHEAFLTQLNRVFDAHAAGGTVRFDYETKLHLGQFVM